MPSRGMVSPICVRLLPAENTATVPHKPLSVIQRVHPRIVSTVNPETSNNLLLSHNCSAVLFCDWQVCSHQHHHKLVSDVLR